MKTPLLVGSCETSRYMVGSVSTDGANINSSNVNRRVGKDNSLGRRRPPRQRIKFGKIRSDTFVEWRRASKFDR